MRFVVVIVVLALLGGWWARRVLTRRGRRRLGLLVNAVIAAPIGVLAVRVGIPWLPGPTVPAAETVRPGITYERQVALAPRPRVAHVVRVDLATPGLRLAATRPDDPTAQLPYRARTTTTFAEETGAIAAINGDFFEPWEPGLLFGYPAPGQPVRSLGPTWTDGVRLSSASHRGAHVTLGPGPRIAFGEPPGPAGDVVGGLCMLVERGAAADLAPCRAKKPWQVHPRSAIAVDRARGQLLLVVVDGRQPRYSLGAELDELAQLLVDLGADEALSLDGGGSSALVVRDPGGSPRLLGSPIADRVPGRERPIANHIGVFVDG